MSIFRTILARGYFPKELPPAFFTDDFAKYAVSRAGRKMLRTYAPVGNSTECVGYRLALPGIEYRSLAIPHPASFSKLVDIVSRNFKRLLGKTGRSKISRSRPVFALHQQRALRTLVLPANLARERAVARAGCSFLLKADVSQYYPSLYTHAVGWAIDPKLRQRAHWQNRSLLGKQVDQALMDQQGKVSQGIPIGNDVSHLLAEVVLAEVDQALKLKNPHCYRWFDDYEIACSSRREAEEMLAELAQQLARFRLRLNPKKTQILALPQLANDSWQDALHHASKNALRSARQMVRYFDTAFVLREEHPSQPVLMYALGALFRPQKPESNVLRVAESCISQSVLCEPGSAQKAFALLSFWTLSGCEVDDSLARTTIERMIARHEALGVSSDVAWGLAYAIQRKLELSASAGKLLTALADDCIAIQALHAHGLGLLPKGFSPARLERDLKLAAPDEEHWLLIYEAVRHGFLPGLSTTVKANKLFASMLRKGVSFYRLTMPSFALVVHVGGAPRWIVKRWIDALKEAAEPAPEVEAQVLAVFAQYLQTMPSGEKSTDDIITELLDVLNDEPGRPEEPSEPAEGLYAG